MKVYKCSGGRLKTIAHAALQWPLAKNSLLFLVLESNWLYVIE